MLKDEDRIFKNLYNDLGADLISAKKRGDWKQTDELISKGRDWIIDEIKKLPTGDKLQIEKNVATS